MNVLAFGILAAPRRRPRVSVFGHFRRNGHHYFPIFLLHGFDSDRVDPLYQSCVRIRDPSSEIVLSVKFRTVLDLDRLSVTVPVASIW